MRHMRKILATLAAAALLVCAVAAVPAAAKPGGKGVTAAQEKRVCEKRGGTWIDLDGLAGICLLPSQ
jgi:Spy/CpxP family protein refolding chaperone